MYVSPAEAGTVLVEVEHWSGGTESWELSDGETVTPTTVYEKEIAVKAVPAGGSEFVKWSSSCTDEDLLLDQQEMVIRAYRTNCVTAYFATASEPDPDPEPQPEPPDDCGQDGLAAPPQAIMLLLE